VLERDGRIRSASASFERLLGYSLRDPVQMSIADIVHPDDLDGARTCLHGVLERAGTNAGVVRVRANSGSWHSLAVELVALEDGQGRVEAARAHASHEPF
jgi:PAS domain S-box-containing protein